MIYFFSSFYIHLSTSGKSFGEATLIARLSFLFSKILKSKVVVVIVAIQGTMQGGRMRQTSLCGGQYPVTEFGKIVATSRYET